MDNNILKSDGTILAARYAYMPNRLRYCGGDNVSELLSYIKENQTDDGLKELLEEFATMFPYLKLIARANHIADPFNYKVVEAYWLGNELLENVSMDVFYRSLIDDQMLKKKFKSNILDKVFGQIPIGAKPHHSFHVFNIPKRTGHYPVEHSLKTMDECRIAGARIVNYESGIASNLIRKINVKYQPLAAEGNKIKIGEPVTREVWAESSDKAYGKKLAVGDWVAVHWGWVCDFITEKQVSNLKIWTEFNLGLLNSDI